MRVLLFSLLAGGLLACSREAPAPDVGRPAARKPKRRTWAERVTWDHILITFRGSTDKAKYFRGRRSFRPPEAAQRLARSLLDRIRAGADFNSLKAEFSDDRNLRADVALPPYVMLNDGVPRRLASDAERSIYARRFGDLVFGLKEGEVGLVGPEDSPLGWHVIKVLKRE